jgi:hypothetical protein
MRQIQADNRKWAPVDEEDKRHLQKIQKKNQMKQEKEAKLREKRDILLEEEAKEMMTSKKKGKR